MDDRISVAEVKDLGGGKYAVRLELVSAEATLSQTQTVSADGLEAAVQVAREAFIRWLRKAAEYAVRNLPPKMRN